MTGVNYSKTNRQSGLSRFWMRSLYSLTRMTHNRHKSGQVLLITIMLIAVVLTVVLSITFTSRTETQLTKLEEENQKALAAAEAGIEAALKSGGTVAINSLNVPSGFTGTATVTAASGGTFVSPFLADGQQYTFYLATYPGFGSPISGNLNVNYWSAAGTSANCSNLALEITFVSGNTYTITRYKADVGNILNSNVNEVGQTGSTTIEGVTFQCRGNNIAIPANARYMLVRVIGSSSSTVGTKLGFNGNTFPTQGNYVISEAKSPSGVTKKVQLFQSNPQLPADFYVTSF